MGTRNSPIRERHRDAFFRFGLTGAIFTFLGPFLFWLSYPLGPFLAAAIAEISVHFIRFFAFRALVFPAHKGYNVNFARYIISALPVTLACFASVALFHSRLDRTSLTVITACIAVSVGFLWSRTVYAWRPEKKGL
jgi:putative flippase GtrA